MVAGFHLISIFFVHGVKDLAMRYCVSRFRPVISFDLRAVIAGQKVVGM